MKQAANGSAGQSGGWSRAIGGRFLALLLLIMAAHSVATLVGAVTLTVDSIADLPDARPGDGLCSVGSPDVCTLRAAVQEANATPEEDVIRVPSLQPRFRLTIRGSDAEDASQGDLDVLADLVIEGVGPGVATIDGDRGDRIFDIFSPARVTIRNLVLQSGQVEAAGGAVRNAGVLRLEGVTLRDNSVSTGSGGALANLPGAVATVINSTFFNNTAAPNGQGGAVANLPSAVLELDSVTFSTNGATAGGAIHNLGTATIHNSIVAHSSLGANCAGVPLQSLGYNLDTGTSCLLDQFGDLNNADPRLAGLTFNGGLSLTMALQPGSDAIDRGDPMRCPSRDQRGFPRPADGNGDAFAVCDIGAFEVNPPTPTPTISFTPTPTVPSPTPPPSATSTPPLPTSSPTRTVIATETPTVSPTASPGSAPPTLTATNTVPTPTASMPPEHPILQVDTVAAVPGAHVPVAIRLHTAGRPLAAVQAELSFDPINAPIAPRETGIPDCLANPELGKSFEVQYRPAACVGEACMRVAAFLFSELPPLSIIPDGSVLWTCTVAVSTRAAAGAYSLTITDQFVADDEGDRVVDVILHHGAVVVVLPTTTPMFTASPTPSPTSTPRCAGDCNGDGLVTIEELITLVGIGLELRPAQDCLAGDGNQDGQITVEEIVAAVNRALGGCSEHRYRR
ncbi:MAG: hypothetical protein N3C12_03255 [Candidatus Binatia bacterium]|nr:hypothetical protein [Candidatus Binatia bacterium]